MMSKDFIVESKGPDGSWRPVRSYRPPWSQKPAIERMTIQSAEGTCEQLRESAGWTCRAVRVKQEM